MVIFIDSYVNVPEGNMVEAQTVIKNLAINTWDFEEVTPTSGDGVSNQT